MINRTVIAKGKKLAVNLKEMIGQERIDKGFWWSKNCGLQIVEGCTKVSPGCDNCWSLTAANMRRFNPNPKMRARYLGTVDYQLDSPDAQCRECQDPPFECEGPCRPKWTGQVNPQWEDLDKIGRARKPQVYTFWNDLFHPGVGPNFQNNVMFRILEHQQHFFIICTKRPHRALEYLSGQYGTGGSPFQTGSFRKNLMIMTTVENQDMADRRLPALLQIPGVLHGVSVEPGLGPVAFGKVVCNDGDHLGPSLFNHGAGAGLDWVICGGETGPHARPMHPDIPRKLRDDCQAAEVPFFFKAWGEWQEGSDFRSKAVCVYHDGRTVKFDKEDILAEENRSGIHHQQAHPTLMSRVGKKAAGRLLDGRTWEEVPEVGP